MPHRTLPGLGITAFWDLGFDGWKDTHDADLRLLSAVCGQRAISTVSADPGSPANGDVHLTSAAHGTQPRKIAVRDNGAWVYLTVPVGTLMFDAAAGFHRTLSATDWVPMGPLGKQTIPVMAGAMVARTTNGPASGTTESTTNKVMSVTLDFDQAADEFAQFMVPMPKGWDKGTVTARFIWTAGATGNVVWGIQGVAISDDDVLDAAFGTAVTVTDGVTAAGDVMRSAETGAVTIGGSPAEGDLAVFQVYRDADNLSDTVASDAKLIGVELYITYNAGNDA